MLAEILAEAGNDVSVGAVIGRIDQEGAAAAPAPAANDSAKEQALAEGSGPPAPVGEAARAAEQPQAEHAARGDTGANQTGAAQAGPAARKIAEERGVNLSVVPAPAPRAM